MLNNQTVQTLRSLKLTGMAEGLEQQQAQPSTHEELGFDERLALLVDREATYRNNNKVTRLLIYVHQNQIQDWRWKLLDQANRVFDRGGSAPESEHKVKELHAKIGQLTMERDFLEQGLERIHGPRGKK